MLLGKSLPARLPHLFSASEHWRPLKSIIAELLPVAPDQRFRPDSGKPDKALENELEDMATALV